MDEQCTICFCSLAALNLSLACDAIPSADAASLFGSDAGDHDQLIARLLPCGHHLHHECLKPWVQRANTCPICRADFLTVHLCATIGGPLVSSYSVRQKKQVADADSAPVWAEWDGNSPDANYADNCYGCGMLGDVVSLMQCVACNRLCHVHCAGLDAMPTREWLCDTCADDPELVHAIRRERHSGRSAAAWPARLLSSRGPRGSWLDVWQSVYSRFHIDLGPIDLDHPHDDVVDTNPRDQAEAHPLRPSSTESSRELMRAWSAFDHARDRTPDSASGHRRRKRHRSPTPSPSPSPPPDQDADEPDRRRKRPRLRSLAQPAEPLSSFSLRRPTDAASHSNLLQSLLEEVNADGGSSVAAPQPRRAVAHSAASPQNSSPRSSAAYPTPAGMTPPPLALPRASSPQSGTSGRSPSPYSSYSPASRDEARARRPQTPVRGPRDSSGALCSPPRSSNASPSHADMSYSTKVEIQRMVKAELKPRYTRREIAADDYTAINRDVSRLLYDCIGSASGLADESARERWQKVAADQVACAVDACGTSARGKEHGNDATHGPSGCSHAAKAPRRRLAPHASDGGPMPRAPSAGRTR